MFEVKIFTEILIVGLFLLVGLWPLFLLVKKEVEEEKKEEARARGADEELFPITDDYVSKVKRVVIILLLAYAVGAAGNRLSDDFWEKIVFRNYEMDEQYEVYLQRETALLRAQQGSGQLPDSAVGSSRIRCEGEVLERNDCLKVAQMLLRERGESTRDWLDNRRAYIRIMRAASLSLVLLMISMLIYKVRWWGKSRRYRICHFAIALFFLCVITYAHKEAETRYWRRVYELYVGLPPVVVNKD